MAALTQVSRNKYVDAGFARGERTRDRVLVLVADPLYRQFSDAELAKKLGLCLRSVKGHLKILRERGIITTELSWKSYPRSTFSIWKTTRIISITEAGKDAVRQSKISLEGSPHPG